MILAVLGQVRGHSLVRPSSRKCKRYYHKSGIPKSQDYPHQEWRNRFRISGRHPLPSEMHKLEESGDQLSGKKVVPGFIDPHCHLVSYAYSFVTLEVGPRYVSTISDIQNLVRKAAHELPPERGSRAADTINSIWPRKGILPDWILMLQRRLIRSG